MEYLPTLALKIAQSCRYIYQHHGAYGIYNPCVEPLKATSLHLSVHLRSQAVAKPALNSSPANRIRSDSQGASSPNKNQRLTPSTVHIKHHRNETMVDVGNFHIPLGPNKMWCFLYERVMGFMGLSYDFMGFSWDFHRLNGLVSEFNHEHLGC